MATTDVSVWIYGIYLYIREFTLVQSQSWHPCHPFYPHPLFLPRRQFICGGGRRGDGGEREEGVTENYPSSHECPPPLHASPESEMRSRRQSFAVSSPAFLLSSLFLLSSSSLRASLLSISKRPPPPLFPPPLPPKRKESARK